MITSIIDYQQQKCWKQESNLSNITFKRINVIFGHNGAGKSSLAKIMAESHLSDGDVKSVRLFGAKYVESKLMLEDKSGIRGVVSNFGEKDVDIEKQVNENIKKIDELKENTTKQLIEKQKLIDQVEKLIKDVVRRRKDKNTKIHNKSENKPVNEKVALWVKDYDDALKQFPDEDYNAITGNADFSAENEQLNLLTIPEIPTFENILVDELATILETEYKSLNIPESEVVKWLQSGVHIHEGKNICEFCGATVDIDAITKRVDSYLNDAKHKATSSLEMHNTALGEIIESAQLITDNKSSYEQALNLTDGGINFDAIVTSVNNIRVVAEEIIVKKIAKMESANTLNKAQLTDSISIIATAANELQKAKKQTTQNLLDKINLLETLVKGAIGLEIKNTEVISENLEEIVEISKQVSSSGSEQKKLKDENQQLLDRKSDLADFATYLNEVLKDLNLNFSLILSGKVYVLKHSDGSPLKLDDISDGERNLLSLIYFYYEMLDDTSGKFKDSIQLIVIDDPISSLDDGNKFYITELVKSILDQKTVQVFVLTHSWDDFCNMAYGRKQDDVLLSEIKKETSVGNVYTINNEKLLRPYMMLYREVNNFSQTDAINISDETALHMPNTMRRVLEEYVKFRVNVDFATAGHDEDIAKAIFGKDLSQLSPNKKQKLNNLLAICNILSHKANQPKNPAEIHKSAKFLIASIEEFDKFHHSKMIGAS